MLVTDGNPTNSMFEHLMKGNTAYAYLYTLHLSYRME